MTGIQNSQTHLNLTFAPYESYFVVFDPNQKPAIATRTGKSENRRDSTVVTGPWQLTFDKHWGAPDSTVLPKLISWTQSDIPGIRYFSGKAVYSKNFENTLKTNADDRIYLDLGQVEQVAEAWLNGKPLGIVWTPPYRYDVTDAIRKGSNALKIEVINTWSNRIIGDLTSTEKFTKTNLNVRGSRELLWKDTPLTPSGLLGPVVVGTADGPPTTAAH